MNTLHTVHRLVLVQRAKKVEQLENRLSKKEQSCRRSSERFTGHSFSELLIDLQESYF